MLEVRAINFSLIANCLGGIGIEQGLQQQGVTSWYGRSGVAP